MNHTALQLQCKLKVRHDVAPPLSDMRIEVGTVQDGMTIQGPAGGVQGEVVEGRQPSSNGNEDIGSLQRIWCN